MTDVIAGNVSVMFDLPSTALPHVHSGRIKLLGSTSPTRSPLVPNVPTLQESGVTGYDVTSWFGIFAPTGTPASIIERMNHAANDTMIAPELTMWLTQNGYAFTAQTPEQLAERIRTESMQWERLIRQTGIQAD